GGGVAPAEGANMVYAGPTGGGPASPDFRALVKDDIPWGTPDAIGAMTPDAGTFTTLAVSPAAELTIASGAVVPAQTFHTVDTEADAAVDDLDTIAAWTDGQLLFLKQEAGARLVQITQTGNIFIPGMT